MKIEIYIKTPSKYEGVKELKSLIGNTKTKAFSLDDDNNILEGEGYIDSNDSYNYHNNYDDSEDCMWFKSKYINKQQWFTLNYDRVLEVQKENNKKIIKVLEPIINRVKENIK